MNIVLGICTLMLGVGIFVLGIKIDQLERKVERILESGWFPEPREER